MYATARTPAAFPRLVARVKTTSASARIDPADFKTATEAAAELYTAAAASRSEYAAVSDASLEELAPATRLSSRRYSAGSPEVEDTKDLEADVYSTEDVLLRLSSA